MVEEGFGGIIDLFGMCVGAGKVLVESGEML